MTGRGWRLLGYGCDYSIVDDHTTLIRDGALAEAHELSHITDFSVNESLDQLRGGHWQPADTWLEDLHTVVVWKKQTNFQPEKDG